MKKLILIRHAKSSWSTPAQRDFDRPLNDRGQRDAPVMGSRLKAAGLRPDLVIASTARRAEETARHIAAGTGYDTDRILWQESLYHCAPAVFEEVLADVSDDVETVFIVAHNPGISEFAASLDASRSVHHMPTCATVGIAADVHRWSDFVQADTRLFLFDSPKTNHE